MPSSEHVITMKIGDAEVVREAMLHADELLGDAAELIGVLRKFANHRASCHCFICRNLTDNERNVLHRDRGEA